MPFTFVFTQRQIADEREMIDCLKNVVLMGGSLCVLLLEGFCGMMVRVGYAVFVHVFFNPVRAVDVRERIFAW